MDATFFPGSATVSVAFLAGGTPALGATGRKLPVLLSSHCWTSQQWHPAPHSPEQRQLVIPAQAGLQFYFPGFRVSLRSPGMTRLRPGATAPGPHRLPLPRPATGGAVSDNALAPPPSLHLATPACSLNWNSHSGSRGGRRGSLGSARCDRQSGRPAHTSTSGRPEQPDRPQL